MSDEKDTWRTLEDRFLTPTKQPFSVVLDVTPADGEDEFFHFQCVRAPAFLSHTPLSWLKLTIKSGMGILDPQC